MICRMIFIAECEVELNKMLNGMEELWREDFGSKVNKSKTNVMKIFKNGSKGFYSLNIKIWIDRI